MEYSKILNIFLLFIPLLFVKEIKSQTFLDLIKLPFYDSYFIVLNSGLYLYNFNNLDCSLLYKFTITKTSNDKIYLNELVYKNKAFVFCLVNEYLHIFNEQNNRTIQYKIEDINFNSANIINILPYKYEYNNISFIIAYYNEPTKITFNYYNFSLKYKINKPKEISFDNVNIKDNMINCLIKPLLSKIFCYFYNVDTNNHYFISLATYSIEDMDINPDNIFNCSYDDSIIQMKVVSSYNNKFFICIIKSSESRLLCHINNGQSNILENNFNICTNANKNYRIFYFNDTGDFIAVSANNKYGKKINSLNGSSNDRNFQPTGLFIFSIIYQINKSDYVLIKDSSLNDFGICNETKILYEFQNKYHDECPNEISYESKEIPYFCEARCSEEKPLEKVEDQTCLDFCGINDIENKICILKYNNKDNSNLILNNIKKDINTINFDKKNLYNNKQNIIIEEKNTKFIITTNEILKKENNNFINLGECENILATHYGITDIDKLIIFIIDIKEESISNNKIVFEVYSELNNDNFLSKLDLDMCNNINNNEISKCSKYSIESLLQDLCISCNNPYYPIYDNNNKNSYIKCFKNPKGYYLDENKHYQKCYSSCDYCSGEGDENYHNCIQCSQDFLYELHFNSINTINCYQECEFNTYYNETSKKYYCTISSSCPEIYDKLIPEKKTCVKKCDKGLDYRYEFRHTCYENCPDKISVQSKNKKFYCEAICPKEFPFEIISTQYCVDSCSIYESQNGLCKINYESKEQTNSDKDNKEVENKAVKNIQEEMTKSLDTTEIDKGESITIKLKDSTISISTTENQKNDMSKNVSTIDLGECENKIKEEYNIPKNKSLYILKLDIKQEGYKIPKTEYEVYYPLYNSSLTKLDMTVCSDIKISIINPISITGNIDKVNTSSGYYNDICYTTTSENGTDISLSDRKQDLINNNLSVCEEDCDFVKYNMGKAVCSCKVKTNSSMQVSGVIIDKEKLLNNFVDFKNIANILILKCYKLIFKIEAFKNNIGNIFMIIIIILLLLTIIIFYRKDYMKLKEYFYKIIFLKINEKKVKNIVQKKEREEEKLNKKKMAEGITNNNNLNLINNLISNKGRRGQKGILKKNDNNNNYINNKKNSNIKIEIAQPIYLLYKQAIETNLNSNPNKKKLKKNENNKKENNNQNNTIIINNDDSNNSRTAIDKNDLTLNIDNKIIKLNENQIYQMAIEINPFTISELNDLAYKDALKIDNRTFCLYYLSLIKTKHIIYFSFIPYLDYNSRILKMYLFFFNLAINFTVNALFFNDKAMHKIYEEGGTFNFVYNIPQIIYSALISGFIDFLLKILALSESNFIELKKYKYKEPNDLNIEAQKIWSKMKIKFMFFFIINLCLLILFWFYLACFCAVYKNTQIHLIKDTVISFCTSIIYPIFIYIIPTVFRINALKSKRKSCMFNFSKALEIIL